MANYKAERSIPQDFTRQQVKKLLTEAKSFLWDEPFLFKRCLDGMIRRCIPEEEMKNILWHCHNSSYGGHIGVGRTAAKILQSGFYWPSIFKDAREFVEAIATTTCDANVVLYGVTHKVATPYHPQTNGQAEQANRELKKILEKTLGATRKDWAFCATKLLNLDTQAAGEKRFLQLNKLKEFRLEAYENARIYKERVKKWQDKRIAPGIFEPGQKLLLFNSRLKIFPGKLRSKWTGPYTITRVSPHGHLELLDEVSKEKFTVNGYRVKHYLGGSWNQEGSVHLLT
ncbi:uncharacterized protein LOC107646749 [Arachis ipaensis]|uniref:uncharacterized protein LOC107646749 n=1 Tax=Arachis ipaensis TaxID=130454 RepID=UPI0007AFB8C8|nr:uncharacterized protein LOC107646749 [Arachis ipaensis]XP_025661450.1 uncharacterized protein LOC112757067 [Arachis hypogaea]